MKMRRKIHILTILFILIYICRPSSISAADISIEAKASLLMEYNTGSLLHEQNADERMYPASTTKVMTALLALENADPDDVVTVSKSALDMPADSSRLGLLEGEQLTMRDMLYCIMVASSNDAANAVAEHIAGSQEAFVTMMNNRARELGCTNTHYTNAHGYHDPEHYTTANDLYKVTAKALEYPEFIEMSSAASRKLDPTNLYDKERTFYTTNHLISQMRQRGYLYTPATGIKTGSTSDAGYCLIASAEKNGLSLVSIVLGAELNEETQKIESFTETVRLFEWGFENYSIRQIVSGSEPIAEVKVSLGQDKDYVVAVPEGTLEGIVPSDFDPDKLEFTTTLPDELTAPVEKGQMLGQVSVSYEDRNYGTLRLLSLNSVARSDYLYYTDIVLKFLNKPVTKTVAAAIGGLFLLYIIITILINRSRKRYMHPKRRRR